MGPLRRLVRDLPLRRLELHVPREAGADFEAVALGRVERLERRVHRQALARLPDDAGEVAGAAVGADLLDRDLGARADGPVLGPGEDDAAELLPLESLRARADDVE